MIDLTIPITAYSIGLPAFQVYRTIRKGKMKHKSLRLFLDIFFSEATVIYDGILWMRAKYAKNIPEC